MKNAGGSGDSASGTASGEAGSAYFGNCVPVDGSVFEAGRGWSTRGGAECDVAVGIGVRRTCSEGGRNVDRLGSAMRGCTGLCDRKGW